MTEHDSPPWSRTTKTIIVLSMLILALLMAWRFQSLIQQLTLAAVLAYVLTPLIRLLDEKSPLSRGTSILLIYIGLIVLTGWGLSALGVAAYRQVNNLITELPILITDLIDFVQERVADPNMIVTIGPFQFGVSDLDWQSIQQELLGLVQPAISQGGQLAGQLATSTLQLLGNLFFIFVVSIYIAIEIPRLGEYVGRVAQQPGYRHDAERLMQEFGYIWSAYLRGQIILGLVIGVLVGVILGLLGVQNALALGILSGLLEFIPVIGPVIGAAAAVIVAFFQPENVWGLSSLELALATLVIMLVIQQLENNLLVPRIVGDALDLHPLLVMIGVFMGGSIAGILGAILAAPVLATLKLLGVYAWRKIFDLPPFPNQKQKPTSPRFVRWVKVVWHQWRKRLRPEPSPSQAQDQA